MGDVRFFKRHVKVDFDVRYDLPPLPYHCCVHCGHRLLICRHCNMVYCDYCNNYDCPHLNIAEYGKESREARSLQRLLTRMNELQDEIEDARREVGERGYAAVYQGGCWQLKRFEDRE